MEAVSVFKFSRHAVFRGAMLGLVLASLAVLPACNDEKTRNAINERASETQQALASMDHQSPNKHYNPLVVSDKVWAGNAALRMHRGIPLPAKYETARGVTFISTDSMSLADIANAITEQTGIPVRVNEAGAKGAAANNSATMPISYEGPLSNLMERVSGYFGVGWHYDGATITVSRFETRVFVIEALPGTQQVSEGMQDASTNSTSATAGSAQNTGGLSAGSVTNATSTNSITQNSKFSIDIKYWDELGQILTSMIGGTGTVVVSPSIGTVTITTSPEIMRSIASYLSQENQRLSRQIAIGIEVYTVTLNEGMDFNVAFNTALKRLTNFGANWGSVGAPAEQQATNFTGIGTGLSVAILNPNTVGQVTDIFRALSAIGDTTKIAKFPVVTLNNRPVSRRVGQDVTYAAQTLFSPGTTVTGATSAVVPGIIPQGFTVQLVPRLLDDGRILLEYSLSIVDVLSIDTFTSGTGDNSSSIQTPKTANRIFVQQSVLKSGSTLIIGGAEEEDMSQNSQGVGSPFNYILGGGVSSGKAHTMVFFALSPQVLDVPHSEQD